VDKFVDIDLSVTWIMVIGLYVQNQDIFEMEIKIMSNDLHPSFSNVFCQRSLVDCF
jgi:hypothetical protein